MNIYLYMYPCIWHYVSATMARLARGTTMNTMARLVRVTTMNFLLFLTCGRKRDYKVCIEASEVELDNLSKRFNLGNV